MLFMKCEQIQSQHLKSNEQYTISTQQGYATAAPRSPAHRGLSGLGLLAEMDAARDLPWAAARTSLLRDVKVLEYYN